MQESMTPADAARLADACERARVRAPVGAQQLDDDLKAAAAHFRTLASSPADSELADTFEKMIGRSDRSVIIPRGFANDVLAALRAKPTVAADSAEDAAGVVPDSRDAEIATLRSALPAAEKGRDEAKSAIGRLRRYADDLEAAGAAYENRVQELEKALAEALQLCDAAPVFDAVDPLGTITRLRSLLHPPPPATAKAVCGTCGGSRTIGVLHRNESSPGAELDPIPCPACTGDHKT